MSAIPRATREGIGNGGIREDNSYDPWELDRASITVEDKEDKLGQGAFGVVNKGYIRGPLLNNKVKVEFRNASHIPVAIKMLKSESLSNRKHIILTVQQSIVYKIEILYQISCS